MAADLPSVDASPRGDKRNWRDAAVVISAQNYDHMPEVDFAERDGDAVIDWMATYRGLAKKRMFHVQDPNDEELRSVLARGVARVRSRGTLWVYYAGHGAVVDGEARIFGADLTVEEVGNALPLSELERMANRSRAERVVIVIDAAFDGRGRSELDYDRVPPGEFSFRYPESTKVVVWMADERGEAQVYPAAEHGLFTWLWLGSLRGWADGADGSAADGQITVTEAQRYISDQSAAMGRAVMPSVMGDAKGHDWVLSDGDEAGPERSAVQQWSMKDRDRRLAAAIKAKQSQADAALKDAVAKARAGDPQGEALVQQVLDDYRGAEVQLRWAVPLPAVAEAYAMLADPSQLAPTQAPAVAEGTDTGETGETDTGEVAPPEPEVQLSDDTCDDLISMEPDALMGLFSPGRIECVETRVASAKEKQTDKDKLSRLLMANAESKQDWAEWERLALRHLEELGRSDPDLCFRYAYRLSKRGVEFGEQVIRWADYALENKQKWSGDMFKKRVYDLYRLKTEAANELWRDAEQNLIADPTEQNDALTLKHRGRAKNFAREWLDYARASEQKLDRPLALCLSAAGAMKSCEDR